jgi:hypothetical protein
MELFTQYLYGDLNVDDISYIKLLFGLWDGDPRTYGNPMKASPSKYYGLNDTGFLSVGVTGEHFFDNVAKLYYKAIFSPEADVNPDWASPAKVLFTNNKSIDVLVGGEVTVAPGQALWLQGHISPLFPEKGDAIVRMGAAGGANVTFVKDRLAAGVQGHVYDVGQNIIWGTTGILKLNLSDKTRKLLNMISFWGGLRDAPSGAGWTDAEGSSFDMGQKAKQGEAGISLLLFKEQLALSYAQIWSLMGREDSNYDNVSLFAIDWYWGKTFGIQ